ncbi:ATM1 mitochondrial ABC transporter [Encephalitozoon hellem ATCC 50504]|uniref:ABC transporter protein n=1 Tax=Encephalitozoon hellem TaxID=27973 RepID=A0A9Q9C8U4_ENCHE|nr:mitochondrial ABC transporter [Encephalitozoon hellem ATCC 50504]XP_003886736.1 ATM1 mitochondrial ABC transporter [Encephalitozoon hellem ATCC 50504]UTX42321.1 ABC transporter protein [Encephalitozoon hellem]AFM97632.1 mitochondrial ABC transporter [Encephalitozoon hellem ATCC 50504]AFM97755.1 ATM1 mitochondrial ABC transporter [Encephalitozoon hellem ATCC 50504]UTX42448.1 ABC transporter protein [Encephalitozoon hellem]|eukprot:XP_003886613.1 mitochondrial ABC transporter [Encephalitozoon hellem ATCC 50504]
MKGISHWTIWRRLFSMARPTSMAEMLVMAALALCIFFGKWLDVASIKRRGMIINSLGDVKGVGAVDVSSICSNAMTFFVFRTLSSVLIESKSILFSVIANRIVEDMTTRVLHLAIHSAHSYEIKPTNLNRVVERGNKKVCKVLGKILTIAVPAFYNLILLFREVYAMFGTRYFFPALLTVVVYTGYTYVALRIRSRYKRRINHADNLVSKRIHECISNIDLVRACCCEEMEESRVAEVMRRMWGLKLYDKGCVGVINFGQRTLFTILFVYTVLKGVQDASASAMAVGDLATLFSFVLSIDTSMWTLGTIARDMGFWMTDCTDLLTLYDGLERDVEESSGAALQNAARKPGSLWMPEHSKSLSGTGESEGGRGVAAIEFEDVKFSYPRSTGVLKGLSFRVMRGERVGIIGRSGCGKSTIVKLLLMLHRYSGSIRVYGSEIREMCPRALRSSIGCILQDALFFDESILYNVRYGNSEAGMSEVLKGCRDAGLCEVIRKKGLDSRMGDLSGGEAQMACIARCLAKDPPMMLLDEATSKLDGYAEKRVFELLMSLEGKTIVMILHDLWMTEHMDKIIVVEDGRAVEVGRHCELMEAGGVYWRMKTMGYS